MLAALIIVARVANLNLSVANVALPDIGKHFDSPQTPLDVIAVGYSLGLACSVLWLDARRPLRPEARAEPPPQRLPVPIQRIHGDCNGDEHKRRQGEPPGAKAGWPTT